MLSVSELALFLKTSAARTKAELTTVTSEYLEGVAKDARAIIGQQRQEWDALAPATIAEKRKLGYYGKVSETDPLLRKGDMRESIKSHAEPTFEGAEGAVGSESKILLYQEGGTSRIPPRPVTSIALRGSEAKAREEYGMLGMHLTTPPVR